MTGETRHDSAGLPVLALGFRPFYLSAGLFAVLALPLWLGVYLGLVQPHGYLTGIAWHSHEMVFGFASAVIAGFLLTAVRTWTGQPTPTGAVLATMLGLWVLARLLVFTGPGAGAIAADVAFLPALGVAVGIPIWRGRNRRNYKVLLLLGALTLANIVYHAAHMNVLPVELTGTAITAALDIVTLLMAVVGGRVIPAFTANAVSHAQPRRVYMLELVSMTTLVLVFAAGVLEHWQALSVTFWSTLLTLAALTQALRWVLWKPHKTWRSPLLWMLPAAYLWIPASLALRAMASVGAVAPLVAVHALTVGAISALMLAMMMRSALGHTARPLAAGSPEIAAFVLVQCAALARLLSGFVAPEFYRFAVVSSGILWSLGFAVFMLRYAPMLWRSRVDGKPG